MFGINGIINVLKPPGMTSFDVVASLRRILKTKKIGHTGTLDPSAAGVLPLCVGNATKAVEFMIEKDKLYRAELTLGMSTDTQDSMGKITGTCKVDVSRSEVEKVIESFIGKYEQVPPMYSALKVDGRKLYELAREGITVERKARQIEIYSINIIHMNLEKGKILFDVACSKGTYIRTLCADIGERLGLGAHMSFLIRLKAGSFDIASSLTFEEIEVLASESRLKEALISVENVFVGLERVTLNRVEEKKFLNGIPVTLKNDDFKIKDNLKVYNEDRFFIALGEVTSREGAIKLKSKKFF